MSELFGERREFGGEFRSHSGIFAAHRAERAISQEKSSNIRLAGRCRAVPQRVSIIKV
jgi:hypothetical protein